MIFGILFTLLASTCFNASNLLEKRAVDGMPEISARRTGHMIGHLARSRLWLAGFGVGVLAIAFMVLGYALAQIAIVQSIFGAGLVLLVLGSRIYLKEPMGKREWVGLFVIVAAVVLVAVTLGSSSGPGPSGSMVAVLISSIVTCGLAGLLFVLLLRRQGDASVPFGVASGLMYGVASLQIKSASTILDRHGVIRAILPELASPYPYIFVLTSVVGLLIFQTGLQRCRVGVVAPITNVVASVYVVAVGMAVFGDPLPSSPILAILRFGGFGLVLVGSWIFATGPAGLAGPSSVASSASS